MDLQLVAALALSFRAFYGASFMRPQESLQNLIHFGVELFLRRHLKLANTSIDTLVHSRHGSALGENRFDAGLLLCVFQRALRLDTGS